MSRTRCLNGSRRSAGQTTLEFAVLIAVVVGALLAMQIYMKRGVHGKLKESTDQLGDQFQVGRATYNITRNSRANVHEQTFVNGVSMSDLQDSFQGRAGREDLSINKLSEEALIY